MRSRAQADRGQRGRVGRLDIPVQEVAHGQARPSAAMDRPRKSRAPTKASDDNEDTDARCVPPARAGIPWLAGVPERALVLGAEGVARLCLLATPLSGCAEPNRAKHATVRNKHRDYSERKQLTLSGHAATTGPPTRARIIYQSAAFPYIDLRRRVRPGDSVQ
jgi:hypothetical protein